MTSDWLRPTLKMVKCWAALWSSKGHSVSHAKNKSDCVLVPPWLTFPHNSFMCGSKRLGSNIWTASVMSLHTLRIHTQYKNHHIFFPCSNRMTQSYYINLASMFHPLLQPYILLSGKRWLIWFHSGQWHHMTTNSIKWWCERGAYNIDDHALLGLFFYLTFI